jgi:hypothetical protein
VHLRYPARHRRRWRSTNLLERALGEVKRRIKVTGRFPGETSCLTFVWAVLDLYITHATNGIGGQTPSNWRATSARTHEGAGCDGRFGTTRRPPGRNARYHGERYDLYRAKVSGGRPTTMGRLRELERVKQGARPAFVRPSRARVAQPRVTPPPPSPHERRSTHSDPSSRR